MSVEGIDLRRKVSCIFGLRDSGKSTFVNKVATSYKTQCLVYDTLNETPPSSKYISYTPRLRNNVGELEAVIRAITPKDITQPFTPPYRLFIVEEANRFCPPKPHPLPPLVADLNDQCRHYNMGAIFVARRPVQLHQDLTELADYLFVFHLTGKRDIKYLNDLVDGLGNAVLGLTNYQFILVNPNRTFQSFPAIQPEVDWLKRAKHLTK